MHTKDFYDVTESAHEAGIPYRTWMSELAWDDCVAWRPEENARRGTLQHVSGRLWDVAYTTAQAWKRNTVGVGDRFDVELYRVPLTGDGVEPELTRLLVVCSRGEDCQLEFTVMLPGEAEDGDR